MANTIVTLSGEEADLYKAFQRIIDQQNKTDAGYKKIKDASKEAANAAKQAAKDAAAAEQSRAAAIDSVTGKVLAAVGSYVSLQGAVQLVTAAHNDLVQRQDRSLQLAREIAAAQQEAAKNMAGQTPTQIGKALEEQVPTISKATGFADLPKITTALGSAASIVGADAAPSAVTAAAKLTKFTPDELQKTTTATADIMAATGLKDAERAMALLASTGSVARPEQLAKLATGSAVAVNAAISSAPNQDKVAAAGEAVAVYAKLSKVDPEGSASATATVQLIKQIADVFTDTKAARERNDKIDQLRTASTDAPLAIEKAAIQVEQKRMLTTGMDPADQSLYAREARNELAKAEAELAAARQKAAKDAQELTRLETVARVTGTSSELIKQREAAARDLPGAKAELESAQAQWMGPFSEYKARKFEFQATSENPNATEDQRAAAARAVEESTQRFTLADRRRTEAEARVEELQRVSTVSADPGTFQERLALVQKTPELKSKVSESLTGEAKFLSLFRELLDSNSGMSEDLRAAGKAITTDPAAFRALAGTTVQTDQAKITDAETRLQAAVNVKGTYDTESQVSAEIAKTVAVAQTAVSRGGLDYMSDLISAGQRTASRGTDSLPGQILEGQAQIMETIRVQGPNPAKNNIDVLVTALESLRTLSELPAVIRDAEKNNRLEEFLKQQNELQEKTNQLLEQLRANGGINAIPQAPSPQAIRNQVEVNK
jgi:hypothetical protein